MSLYPDYFGNTGPQGPSGLITIATGANGPSGPCGATGPSFGATYIGQTEAFPTIVQSYDQCVHDNFKLNIRTDSFTQPNYLVSFLGLNNPAAVDFATIGSNRGQWVNRYGRIEPILLEDFNGIIDSCKDYFGQYAPRIGRHDVKIGKKFRECLKKLVDFSIVDRVLAA